MGQEETRVYNRGRGNKRGVQAYAAERLPWGCRFIYSDRFLGDELGPGRRNAAEPKIGKSVNR